MVKTMKKIIALLLILVMAICVFPANAFADATSKEIPMRYVTKYCVKEGSTFVSLRREAGLDSEVIGYVQGGEYFNLIWDQGTLTNPSYLTGYIDGYRWAHVQMSYYSSWPNTIGFIANDYVQTVYTDGD